MKYKSNIVDRLCVELQSSQVKGTPKDNKIIRTR